VIDHAPVVVLSLSLTLLVLSGCAVPDARTVDQVDTYHGVEVADPYRWLEDLDGAETAGWIASQNESSGRYLDGLEHRGRIVARLTELWNYERFGVPFKEGGRTFYSRNDGLQDQSVIYVADTIDSEPRILLDPNTFSNDGTVALASYTVSPDGEHLAYSISDGGTDWKTWRVREIESGRELADEIQHTKFSGTSWTADGQGFYYSRYPLGEDGEGDGSAAVKIYHHRIGSRQEDDDLVFEIPEQPRWQPYATVTEDGRYLVITIEEGYFSNAVLYRDLGKAGSEPIEIFGAWDGLYNLIGSHESKLFFLTTKDAPNWRVIAVDVAPGHGLSPQTTEVIAEGSNRLESVNLVGGQLVAVYIEDARNTAAVFDLDGNLVRQVELPGLGTIAGFGGRGDDSQTYYSFTGFVSPNTIYSYDVASGEGAVFRQPIVDVDLGSFETHQVFFESKDGTRVPMFITHRRGIELDGAHPTLLYGYGGFDISLTPAFRPDRTVWLEMGGIFAMANLRGGGEYGEAWHSAGTKLQKQNVFDDFIAAAEYLIAEGYTSTPRLAIQGGSNGGLLVGAVLNQRPDLFGAALPAVGVMDMLRYHLPSSNARAWSSDYGLSENEDEFQALLAYSPYHNISAGTCYPPTWITTADHDDRVVPWHSFKYGAQLQEAQSCENPILVRVETRAGHGTGKPTWMRIEEVADAWSFLAQSLDLAPFDDD
jgi:prolyl oligopeptidase